ncbi:MAG: universal stress protein [Simkaniaceae bacterium]|nr:universal stress protein [Simkaniaceae bacterium]
MHKYQHILLATDLNPDDHIVEDRAYEIAHANNAALSIVHVVEYYYTCKGPWHPDDSEDGQKTLFQDAKENLRSLGEKLNVPLPRLILHMGQTMEVILHTAENIHADLIVVGSHGRHGLGLSFFGSTANRLIKQTKCDVLSVRIANKGEKKEGPTSQKLGQPLPLD